MKISHHRSRSRDDCGRNFVAPSQTIEHAVAEELSERLPGNAATHFFRGHGDFKDNVEPADQRRIHADQGIGDPEGRNRSRFDQLIEFCFVRTLRAAAEDEHCALIDDVFRLVDDEQRIFSGSIKLFGDIPASKARGCPVALFIRMAKRPDFIKLCPECFSRRPDKLCLSRTRRSINQHVDARLPRLKHGSEIRHQKILHFGHMPVIVERETGPWRWRNFALKKCFRLDLFRCDPDAA